MTSQDYEYFSRRARQERESAERCGDDSARHVHRELAERYSAKLAEIAVIQQVPAQG